MIVVQKLYKFQDPALYIPGNLRSISFSMELDYEVASFKSTRVSLFPSTSVVRPDGSIALTTDSDIILNYAKNKNPGFGTRENPMVEVPNALKGATLPLYTLTFDLSTESDKDALSRISEFRTPTNPKNQSPEAASAVVAIFSQTSKGSKLITAGIVRELFVEYLRDRGQYRSASVTMSVLDCRLDPTFLETVPLEKLNPNSIARVQNKAVPPTAQTTMPDKRRKTAK